jgi:hypothetical protein
LVALNLISEHGNFILKWGEAVSVVKEVLNIAGGDAAAARLIVTFEGDFEFFTAEYVATKGRGKCRLEVIGGSKGRYSKVSHFKINYN